MFGYIKPYKPELKIWEYDVFKAYYCGLCKELGKSYGQPARFSLNYEHTFLAVFLSALTDEKIEMRGETCIINPFKKNPVIKDNKYISYAADINVILTYFKFADMKRDGAALAGTVGCLAFSRLFEKARQRHPQKADAIRRYLEELVKLEREKCGRVDEAAEPFARLMKEIVLCPGVEFDDDKKAYMEHMAYNLGRFIYIIDAYDDLEIDIKSGNYNPILLQFGYDGGPLNNFREKIREWLHFNLTFTLNSISEACSKLEFYKNRGIIENILQLGLYKELERIMKGDKKCKTRMKSWA
jgi:hypothetical protein